MKLRTNLVYKTFNLCLVLEKIEREIVGELIRAFIVRYLLIVRLFMRRTKKRTPRLPYFWHAIVCLLVEKIERKT